MQGLRFCLLFQLLRRYRRPDIYSGFPVHTLDLFFRCTVADTLHFEAMDDAAEVFFFPLKDIHPEDFGLGSIRKGLQMFLAGIS